MTVSNPQSSGTIGQTSVSVQKLIDHGARRCGKLAETLTVEQVETSRECLFYLLSDLGTRGINLWASQFYRFGINPGQKIYKLPEGTIDLLNINYVTGNVEQVTSAPFTSSMNTFNTIGLFFGTPNTGVTWTLNSAMQTGKTDDAGWLYYDIPVQVLNSYTVTATGLQKVYFVSNLSEIPMAPLNRDDYFNLPNKEFPSNRPLQYFYEKLVTPQVYLWPVGNDDTVNVNTYIHLQVQDVGDLKGEIFVPQRWLHAVQASLGHLMSIELPGVDVSRISYLEGHAAKLMRDAEDSESDDLPIYFAPNISHYTR